MYLSISLGGVIVNDVAFLISVSSSLLAYTNFYVSISCPAPLLGISSRNFFRGLLHMHQKRICILPSLGGEIYKLHLDLASW